MVRCEACGTENVPDALYCVHCGASLRSSEASREKYVIHERHVHMRRTHGGTFWIIVGFMIILWGLSDLLRIYLGVRLEVWPLILIVIGLYVVYRALSRSRT